MQSTGRGLALLALIGLAGSLLMTPRRADLSRP